MANKAKKIQTSQPFGPTGGLNLKSGVDASEGQPRGRASTSLSANTEQMLMGTEEWSPSGNVYIGGMHRKLSQNNNLEVLTAALKISDVSILMAHITFLPWFMQER
ncbi:photosystem II 10 kDa polypeptide, chloroplastic-like [Phragmites australis]|uniref:photosystem II 10 kDa polypeptide, chloroplastic-like n=1 Tax=Phragmites australis TaxID=29695 RepID=UPI002D794C99|nr:photosystem II 10 kDa polypeptide, chloroplastic-like [Phragmites australis]